MRSRLRDHVAVPEVLDAGLAAEEVVDGVERRPPAAAGQDQQAAAVVRHTKHAIVVGAVLKTERVDRAVEDDAMDQRMDGVGTDQDEVALRQSTLAATPGVNGEAAAGDLLPQVDERLAGKLVGFLADRRGGDNQTFGSGRRQSQRQDRNGRQGKLHDMLRIRAGKH